MKYQVNGCGREESRISLRNVNGMPIGKGIFLTGSVVFQPANAGLRA
ncbi:hypothetical protein ACPPVU_12155 [Mucilaginibacter sp. McL0603]